MRKIIEKQEPAWGKMIFSDFVEIHGNWDFYEFVEIHRNSWNSWIFTFEHFWAAEPAYMPAAEAAQDFPGEIPFIYGPGVGG